jgi:antitoxin component YwqK of YwqJK toxin-antitoxin module
MRESSYDGSDTVPQVLYSEDDGHRWIEFTLKDGAEHGHYVEWYGEGRKTAEGEYLKGKKIGTWSYWTPEGAPTTEEQGLTAPGAFGEGE